MFSILARHPTSKPLFSFKKWQTFGIEKEKKEPPPDYEQ
jgi:hypothetical protein